MDRVMMLQEALRASPGAWAEAKRWMWSEEAGVVRVVVRTDRLGVVSFLRRCADRLGVPLEVDGDGVDVAPVAPVASVAAVASGDPWSAWVGRLEPVALCAAYELWRMLRGRAEVVCSFRELAERIGVSERTIRRAVGPDFPFCYDVCRFRRGRAWVVRVVWRLRETDCPAETF